MRKSSFFGKCMFSLKCGILTALFCMPIYGDSHAVDQNGNIFIVRSDGSRTQITSAGIDSQPDLSADETKVVFIRKADKESNEIWTSQAASGATAWALLKPPIEINKGQFTEFFVPKFSPDGESIYFTIQYAGVTNAIVKISVANPKPQFIAAALNFQIVRTGQYRGYLVAQIRKSLVASGYYYWYWLLTPDGKEVGVVGQNEDDVGQFMSEVED